MRILKAAGVECPEQGEGDEEEEDAQPNPFQPEVQGAPPKKLSVRQLVKRTLASASGEGSVVGSMCTDNWWRLQLYSHTQL